MQSLSIILVCGLFLQVAVAHHSHEINDSHDHPDSPEAPDSFEHYDSLLFPTSPLATPYAAINEASTSSCAPPNNKGLRQLVITSEKLLPKDKIRKIVKAAVANDAEVRNLRQMLRSKSFKELLRQVRNSGEMRALSEYICKNMYFDLKDLVKYLNKVLQSDILLDQQVSGDPFTGRSGVAGMLQDIIDVIPWRKAQEQATQQYREDEYLRKAHEQLRSPDFASLMKKLAKSPKYVDARNRLSDAGMPRGLLKKMLETSLGIDLGALDIEQL